MPRDKEFRTVGIAANTLFHFTDSMDSLIGILTNEFLPRYCLESVDLAGGLADDKHSGHAIPMVCFCDLPVSRLHEHLVFYGNYGIGLTKEWGKSKGISPVSYLYPGATFHNCFKNLAMSIAKRFPKATVPNEPPHPIYDYMELVSYIKPYEGRVFRKGRYYRKRFYDEREWRYVPLLSRDARTAQFGLEPRLSRRDYLDDEKRYVANRRIGEAIQLGFEPNDIRYLFVAREEELVPLAESIELIKGRFNLEDVRRLQTRIMSAENVSKDF